MEEQDRTWLSRFPAGVSTQTSDVPLGSTSLTLTASTLFVQLYVEFIHALKQHGAEKHLQEPEGEAEPWSHWSHWSRSFLPQLHPGRWSRSHLTAPSCFCQLEEEATPPGRPSRGGHAHLRDNHSGGHTYLHAIRVNHSHC